MKIIVLQDRLRSGGTERQSVLLARAFAVAGHATTLLTFRPGGILRPADSPGMRHRALQTFDTGLDWFAPGLRRVVAGIQPDVVLCMGRMANCRAGFLQEGRAGAPAVVATLRTGKPLPWLYRRSLRRVRHIVANSRESRDRLLARQDLPSDRISVIPNALAFPPPAVDVGDDAVRRVHGAGPATVVLLSVGMFRPEKNQRELIEIAATLPGSPDLQLWLAGEGARLDACRRLAARLGCGNRVKFLGFQADPSALYAAADVAVHASSSESLSNFLIEAQAHGRPFVAYAAQGVEECGLPGDTGFVIPRGDRTAFRAAVLRLAQEPAESRSARRARAAGFARETFAPDRAVASYLGLFQRLTG